MKGLICQIYKWNLGDCSNQGISWNHTEVTLTGPEIEGSFEPSEEAPEVVIVERTLHFKNEQNGKYYHAVPKVLLDSGKWTMFGGTFIYSSDSRFPFDYPIKLHDRVEN